MPKIEKVQPRGMASLRLQLAHVLVEFWHWLYSVCKQRKKIQYDGIVKTTWGLIFVLMNELCAPTFALSRTAGFLILIPGLEHEV